MKNAFHLRSSSSILLGAFINAGALIESQSDSEVLESRFYIVIKMVQDVIKVEDDKWTDYSALMVQQAYKEEIEEAVKKVKGSTPERKNERPPRRRKRGYWTPSGFAWFKRKKQKVAPPGGNV